MPLLIVFEYPRCVVITSTENVRFLPQESPARSDLAVERRNIPESAMFGEVAVPHNSVVVPAYRAESHIEAFHASVARTVEEITEDYEIFFVEDCGGDGSWDVIRRLGTADNRVKGLRFRRNFGQHFGIAAGLDHSDRDWVVVVDGGFQDPPRANNFPVNAISVSELQ